MFLCFPWLSNLTVASCLCVFFNLFLLRELAVTMAIFIFQVLLFGTAFLRCYAVLVVRIQNSETIAFGEGGESVVL